MKRGLRIGLVALPLLLAGAHYAYWRISVDRLEQGLAIWRTQRQRAGWTIETGAPQRGGYPLAATVTVPSVRLHGDMMDALGVLPGGLTWNAERVVLQVKLIQPRLLQISATGAQQLQVADSPEIPFRADQLRLVFPLEPGFPRWSDLTIAQLRAGVPTGDTAVGVTVGAFRAHGDLRPAAPQGEAAVTFALRAETIRLPGTIPWALGPDVARVDLDGFIGGPLPRGGTPAQAAIQWRDGGGTIEVGALRVDWGKLAVNASATLALDEQLQPMGTGAARIVGQTEALDALVDSGALTPRAAQMVRTMIALFAAPAAQPIGDGAVEIPLTLQDRRLLTRQLPLGRVPVLQWPGR